MEQGSILASQRNFAKIDADRSLQASPEPTIDLRRYDPRRLGYSLTAHPTAQLSRLRTSGGSPPLLHRDVLRSSSSLFSLTDAEGCGLPHAEAKIASFTRKYQQLSVERAFPEGYRVRETPVQERVKTALKDIVKTEELKRSGQADEQAQLVQVCVACARGARPRRSRCAQNTLVISCGPQRVMFEASFAFCSWRRVCLSVNGDAAGETKRARGRRGGSQEESR